MVTPIGRIRVNVNGARGAIGVDIEGTPSPGQVLTKAAGGNRKYIGSTPVTQIADAVKATDLAADTGAQRVGYLGRSQSEKNKDMPSIRDYSANGNGNDDSSAFAKANSELITAYGGGVVDLPSGIYGLSGSVNLGSRVGFRGPGSSESLIQCSGDGFIYPTGAGDHGQTVLQGFRMEGAGKGTGAALSIAMNTQINSNGIPDRIAGVRLRDLVISGFDVGIRGRNMWHAVLDGVRVLSVKRGIELIGQCVSTKIIGCEIVAEGAAWGDGSAGIFADSFSGYSDGIERRPEAVFVGSETLVFGFDTNIDLRRALSAAIVDCGIDYSQRYGIRVSTVDFKLAIRGNYIAVEHDKGASPREVVGVQIDAQGAANKTSMVVADNTIVGVETPNNASKGVRIDGTNRLGRISIDNNNMGPDGSTLGTALYHNTATRLSVTNNRLQGAEYSVRQENGGGHIYGKNDFVGPIVRTGDRKPDYFEASNGGTVSTGYRGRITLDAGATTQTYTPTQLGLPAAFEAGPNGLKLVPRIQQVEGGASRGMVRAYFNVQANLVVTVDNAFGVDSDDLFLEVTAQ